MAQLITLEQSFGALLSKWILRLLHLIAPSYLFVICKVCAGAVSLQVAILTISDLALGKFKRRLFKKKKERETLMASKCEEIAPYRAQL